MHTTCLSGHVAVWLSWLEKVGLGGGRGSVGVARCRTEEIA